MVLVGAALISLASLMFSFMGGSADAMDLGALTAMQVAATVVALAAVFGGLTYAVRTFGRHDGLSRIWQHTPQWLVFVGLMLGSLAISGEVAYIIVARATDNVADWSKHVPLVSLLTSSVAFCVAAALRSILEGREPPASGRWP